MTEAPRVPVGSALTGWRKSSYSGGGDDQGGDSCVEIIDTHPSGIPVRDSKTPDAPALLLPAAAWSAFVGALKRNPAETAAR
ncbi:DUF397 domain-containing protein [Streptomyces sp. bgisy034]|uniref:DUF397 domain-containing protein n=1 Tax=Streptomyces sp. bgisy034 TaxID=3413774 RepID=UPI003EBE0A7A